MESNTKQHEAAKAAFVSPVDYDEYKQYGDDAAVITPDVMRDMFELLKKVVTPYMNTTQLSSLHDDYAFDSKPSGELHLYDEAFEVQRCEDTPQDKS
jgi:hypothetical protein